MKSLAEMNQMLNELEDLDIQHSAKKKEATAIHDLVEAKRKQIQDELTLQGVDSFKGEIGTAYLIKKFQVKFPQAPETKAAFLAFINERGAFDSLWSVNHQRLNAWFKEEMERMEQNNEMPEVPGLTPSMDVNLGFRRSAK